MKDLVGSARYCFSLILILLSTYTTIYAQNDLNTADSLLVTGKKHFENGDYKLAASDFEQTLAIREQLLQPSDQPLIEAYFYLGIAKAKLVFYEEALELFEQALEWAEPTLGKQNEWVEKLYLELVNIHELMYAPQKAISMAQKAITLFDEVHGDPYLKTGTLNMIIGVCYTDTGQFEDAENYLLRALTIFQKTASPESFEMIRVFSNLGRAYRKMNDFDKAIEYCQKALRTNQLSYDDNHPSMAEFYYNLGKVYSWRGDHEAALKYMLKTLELDRKNLGEDHPSTGGTYGELGGVYADLKRYDESLPLYFKSLEIMEKRLSMTHPAVVAGYNNIAMVYEETERYDQALDFYRLSIAKYKKNPNTGFLMSDTYRNMAKTFYYKTQMDSAFYYLGLGIESIALDFQHQRGADDKYPELDKIQANVFYIKFLRLRSQFFEEQFAQNKILTKLEQALEALEVAVRVVEKVRRSYASDGSRNTLNKNVADIFADAIRLSFDLYEATEDPEYLLKAFRFSEKSKASILWQHMNNDFALANAGIPKERLEEIAQIGAQVNEAKEAISNSGEEQNQAQQTTYFNLKLTYEKAINDLEQYNPNYFQLKYASPKIELHRLIEKIPDERSLLIEYFYDDQDLYIFVISKNGLKGIRRAYSPKLATSILALREFDVQQYLNDQGEDNQTYIAHLNLLYDNLMAPIQLFTSKKERLVIVPHGVFNYLSFDLLAPASAIEDYRALPYLIKTHTIQYAPALSIWEKETVKKQRFQQDFLGFAPFSGQQKTKPS
ncbi:MAG: tetratricopeptide repeat protein, partial [Bacteroidota bacterium]